MGLDPGIRTGVKVAVVDATGKLVDTATVYPHEPRKDWDGALHTLARLCEKHRVALIAIGNGTASRETDRLAADVLKFLQKTADAGVKIFGVFPHHHHIDVGRLFIFNGAEMFGQKFNRP